MGNILKLSYVRAPTFNLPFGMLLNGNIPFGNMPNGNMPFCNLLIYIEFALKVREDFRYIMRRSAG